MCASTKAIALSEVIFGISPPLAVVATDPFIQSSGIQRSNFKHHSHCRILWNHNFIEYASHKVDKFIQDSWKKN